MEEHALMAPPGSRRGSRGSIAADQGSEPVAEHNFSRKKMLSLEQGINHLQKTTRQQHEVVAQIEGGMKSMISETDLRRAIGLAFQEFEHRLEDAFQDSSRKCLAMFSRRDEVVELQGAIGKKVNWGEYNVVLKKLSDLRQHIDTMAESVFIGHREALNVEFAKKADASMVEQALKGKADFHDLNEVRARLERLEVLVSHADARQTAALDVQKEEAAERLREQADRHLEMINDNVQAITSLRAETSTLVHRVAEAEVSITQLSDAPDKLREAQKVLQTQHDEVIVPTLRSVQQRLDQMQAVEGQMERDLQVFECEATEFREKSQRTFVDLSAQVKTNKEHVEFLLEETDMIKRRSRETTKKQTACFKELSDEKDKLSQQLQSIERDLKRHGREVKALENRAMREPEEDLFGGLRALPAPEADPNERLKGMLEQLEKLAFSGPTHEHLGIPFNPDRPPLPCGGISGSDLAKLPRFNASESAPIDSARAGGSGHTAAAMARGVYGLSPRAPAAKLAAARGKR